MDIKRGIAVSPGIAIGPALVLDAEGVRIPRRFVPPEQDESEVERLRKALAAAAREAQESCAVVAAKLGAQFGAIFSAHASMLADPGLASAIETHIRTDHFAAEYALSHVMRRTV